MTRELDRDRGGPQTRARPTLPGEPTFTPKPTPRPRDDRASVVVGGLTLGGILLSVFAIIGILSLQACSSLSTLTRHAAQAQRDTAALVLALDSYLEQCEGQEPRPSGCAEAGRLRAAIEPYTELVK
jgi:hypothetical protein